MRQLNPNLKDFWLTKGRVKILKGGRASSKTWDIGGWCIWISSFIHAKFLCIRQMQNKIAESVYALLVIRIEQFGLINEFEIQKAVIRNKNTGSEFHFYGIQRNIREIKGFEGADICWIEEAEDLTKEQWEVIEPTIRKEGSIILISYNPHLVSDFIESFRHDPLRGIIIRHINYDENPFISKTLLKTINHLKETNYDEYEHIYLGIPRSDDDKVIIKRSWIMAAIDAHLKLKFEAEGEKRVGFDIADSGKDKCATVYAHGSVIKNKNCWKANENELLKSCTKAYKMALTVGAKITYDSIGVGAHAGAKFDELNDERTQKNLSGKVSYTKFIAGSKVIHPERYYIETEDEKIKNKDFFSNAKAQAWWLLSDRFRNTYNAIHNGEKFPVDEMISICSDIDDLETLVTELSTPYRDFDRNSRVKVESKEDLEKRDVSSPNEADACVMAFCPEDKLVGWYDVDF